MDGKRKLIPAVIQDSGTKEVLMLAYMDRESLEKSLKDGFTWFWSRSREKLWKKGETSGNIQKIKEVRYDCDNDAILVLVEQKGEACHTGNRSCFYRRLDDPRKDIDFDKGTEDPQPGQEIIEELYRVITDRITTGKKDSYTYSLHSKGLDEILKKMGEEAIEVILSARYQKKEDMIYEIGDLLYHLLVLMAELGISPGEVFDELLSRRK